MKAVIMAAGKGTRLNEVGNPMPKVLRCACGKPLLQYALETAGFIENEDITIVVGFMADDVIKAFPERRCVLQGDEAYGTGYAVKCGLAGGVDESYDGDIAVLSGDVPLIKRETIEKMAELHAREGNSCTLLSCRSKKPLPFGRIIRDGSGKVLGIKEHKDCTEEERKIDELNVGTYIFDAAALREALPKLNNKNAQGEYYLTDVPLIMLSEGLKVNAYITEDENEMMGVNTYEDLAEVEKIIASR